MNKFNTKIRTATYSSVPGN